MDDGVKKQGSEEEGEVYEYEEEEVNQTEEQVNSEEEIEQQQEEIQNDEEQNEEIQNEEEQNEEQQDEYEEEEYEEQFDQDEEQPKQTTIKKPKPQKPRPPIPKPVKQKPTYIEKYAQLLAAVDYTDWKPKQLYEENKVLRLKLKEISDEVTKLVEENALKIGQQQAAPPVKKKTQSNGTVIDREIEINQKKLDSQSLEMEKLQNRIKDVQDAEYLNKLDGDIKSLEELIKKVEQQKKQEFLKQKQRGKELDKLENQDGVNKLLKEKNDLNRELANVKKKGIELKEQHQKQKDTIKQIREIDLPEILQNLEKFEREAIELRIDVSGVSKIKEQYILLTANKESVVKHCQIMEKKEKQLDMLEKEIKELKKEKERVDAQINQNEMILIDQRRQKEDLKNKVPSEVFKSIPATMTQESITQAMQNEKKQQQESQRKLQSAKPPKPAQELKLPQKNEDTKQVKFQDPPKVEVEEEIVVEEEEPPKHQKEVQKSLPVSQSTPIKQELTPQQPQAKLNSKPFNLLRKSQDQSNDLGQSNVSNQQSNTSEVQQSEYTGPSRVMRMMRRPNQQTEETQFIIHEAKPTEQPIKKNIDPKPIEQQKPLETKPVEVKPVDEYQPTFPTRRASNRPRGLDFQYDSNTTDQQSQLGSQQNEQVSYQTQQTQQQEFPSRRRNRGIADETEQKSVQQPIQQPVQQQPTQQQNEIPANNRRLKLFSDQPEAPKSEEPVYEFQPRQDPGKNQGRRNRGNNKLNIWEEQPQQKENIEEVPEVKDVKQEVQQKQDRELTLDEILGGPKQEEYRPNQQRRKFEVPQEEPEFGGGGRRGIGKQNDKQKELALKAEKGDLLDDFDF